MFVLFLVSCFCFLWFLVVVLGLTGVDDLSADVGSYRGFVKEATLRKCNWVEGEWRDITNMGMLEDEWRARKEQEVEVKNMS